MPKVSDHWPVRVRVETYSQAIYRRRKLRALEILGAECLRCGFSDPRALQFDHIEGGGQAQHRGWGGPSGWRIVLWISSHPTEALKTFQVLCANCNWIKRHERGEILAPTAKESVAV